MELHLKVIIRLISILFITLLQFNNGFSQGTTNNKKCNYAKEPCWIKMMDDPNVNYFEAEKAFNEFWKAHGGEPSASENMEEMKKQKEKNKTPKEKKLEAERQKYIIEYKKFKAWSNEVKPYVQEDGRILSIEERKKIYEEQRK